MLIVFFSKLAFLSLSFIRVVCTVVFLCVYIYEGAPCLSMIHTPSQRMVLIWLDVV